MLQLVLLIPFNKAQNGGHPVTNLVLTVWSEFLRPPETLGAGKKKLRTHLFGDFLNVTGKCWGGGWGRGRSVTQWLTVKNSWLALLLLFSVTLTVMKNIHAYATCGGGASRGGRQQMYQGHAPPGHRLASHRNDNKLDLKRNPRTLKHF